MSADAAATLAALDFPAPVIDCPAHPDSAPEAAAYRITLTCGCVLLECRAHALESQAGHFLALAGIAALGCGDCQTFPVLIRTIDPIDPTTPAESETTR